MQPALKSAVAEQARHADRELRFTVEFPPWHKVFSTNVGDLFRPDPPQPWVTARPAEYWPDALVNRPPAWNRLRVSFLGHFLTALAILWINQLWLDRPHVIAEEIPRTTITHYALSEYLPSVARKEKAVPATRPKAQKAEPEYAKQEIVSIRSNPSSLRQTIVHPNPNLLHQDTKLPNLMLSTAIPSAPVTSNRPMQTLAMDAQQVAPPPEAITQRRMSQLTFPAPPVEVAAPASAATARRLPMLPTAASQVAAPASAIVSGRRMPAVPENGPVVIEPSQSVIAHDARRILLPAQSPEVAAPAPGVATQRALQTMAMAEPQIAPPSQTTSARNFSILTRALQPQKVVPPPQPVTGGLAGTQSQAIGQMLAINIQPLAPVGPVSVPEGNRRGEFAGSPGGKPGASGRPEIKAGNTSADQPPGNPSMADSGPDNVYIAEPPRKIVADAVVAAPAPRPAHKPATDIPTGDRVDTRIFGSRKQYSIRLSMPNLNSITGSWIMRFARLNSEPGQEEDISAPEPMSKVDPAYPMSMMQDQVQGTVTLYAIIRSDGTVGDVRILDGFDARLDENARLALEKWKFRPGTRNGAPVDVEAVVRVPFKLAKPAF